MIQYRLLESLDRYLDLCVFSVKADVRGGYWLEVVQLELHAHELKGRRYPLYDIRLMSRLRRLSVSVLSGLAPVVTVDVCSQLKRERI